MGTLFSSCSLLSTCFSFSLVLFCLPDLCTWQFLGKIKTNASLLQLAWNEDLNMKAKKVRTFLYFSFLIFYLQYILPSKVMSRAWVRIWLSNGAYRKSKKSFQRKSHFVCIKNNLIEIAPFPWGYFDYFLLAFIYSKTICPSKERG